MSREIVAFFDILKKPLTRSEICDYTSVRFSDAMPNLEPVFFADKKYYTTLDKYSARSFLNKYSDASKIFWRKVMRWRWIFELTPFVKMVAVCNTLAFDSSTKESDIDLFVITKSNRLFLARSILTALLHLFGLRRHDGKIAGRFCLSFFVSEDEFNLENVLLHEDVDVYMLFWMRSLKPLFGNEVFKNFLAANQWYLDYFPELTSSHFVHTHDSWIGKVKKLFEFCFAGRFGNYLDRKLAGWQINRARQKMVGLDDSSGTVISETMLKFHDNDKRSEFHEKWRKLII